MTDQLSTNGHNEETAASPEAANAEVAAGAEEETVAAAATSTEPEQTDAPKALSREELTWAMASHLSTFGGFVFPCGNIFAPMLIRAVKAKRMPLIEDQAKESINFQITMSIIFVICLYLKIPIQMIWVLIGYIGIAAIYAGAQARKGIHYRYPLAIRFLR